MRDQGRAVRALAARVRALAACRPGQSVAAAPVLARVAARAAAVTVAPRQRAQARVPAVVAAVPAAVQVPGAAVLAVPAPGVVA